MSFLELLESMGCIQQEKRSRKAKQTGRGYPGELFSQDEAESKDDQLNGAGFVPGFQSSPKTSSSRNRITRPFLKATGIRPSSAQ